MIRGGGGGGEFGHSGVNDATEDSSRTFGASVIRAKSDRPPPVARGAEGVVVSICWVEGRLGKASNTMGDGRLVD